jgi:peroxin-6
LIGWLTCHCVDQESLVKLFVKEPSKIIRSSGQYRFANGLAYEALMTNPVQQGCIISSNRTRVLTVDLSNSAETITDQSLTSSSTASAVFNMLSSPSTPDLIEPREFHVKILQKKWPEARLYPSPNNIDDDESRVYIDIKDLAHCGVFSGDWVLVGANNPKKSRLCRVYGIDDSSETKYVDVLADTN